MYIKNISKAYEWLREEWLSEYEEEVTFEEKKKKEKLESFEEYYFGSKNNGWYIEKIPNFNF